MKRLSNFQTSKCSNVHHFNKNLEVVVYPIVRCFYCKRRSSSFMERSASHLQSLIEIQFFRGHGRRKDFSTGEWLGFFSKIFLGGPKEVKIVFSHSTLRKQPFYLFLLKFQNPGSQNPPALLFRRPWQEIDFHPDLKSTRMTCLQRSVALIWKAKNKFLAKQDAESILNFHHGNY